MEHKIIGLHVRKLAFYSLESGICLFIDLRIDSFDEGTGILVEGVECTDQI